MAGDEKRLVPGEEIENEDIHNEDEQQLTVDGALSEIGLLGRYQILLLILCTFIFNGGFSFQSLVTYYVADDSPWLCTNKTSYDFCKEGPFREGSVLFTKRCQMNRSEWYYEYHSLRFI